MRSVFGASRSGRNRPKAAQRRRRKRCKETRKNQVFASQPGPSKSMVWCRPHDDSHKTREGKQLEKDMKPVSFFSGPGQAFDIQKREDNYFFSESEKHKKSMAGPTFSSHWAVPGWVKNVSKKSGFWSEIEIGKSRILKGRRARVW